MAIILGAISLLFTLINLVLTIIKYKKARYITIFTLFLTIFTFVLEYWQIYSWVKNNDMSALLDVIPTMVIAMTIYAIFNVVVNGVLFIFQNKTKNPYY